ncbi:cyclic AMP-responsive element-binding protein 3-like protein 4 isoform X2 [Melanotaenia boesemani]|nr:cyclic AMP-responsive element-binding protein 3-like protein 4 isoform X2 [Melanotaenia boesemani]XP_041843683.1 cyclic AMP-responsive element-binding protein 3-like protein 4 isoform X2 [Melanotaenia boesemani]XP_041843684.1 cyclic AMP-responsive element-binding protein 3-like protein 4 isoform X2 [Melanotaenia boesemani]XP_041843685.1 cyclic AMP-responsive element-binding protein 3-like protein 4 isoform X2 [Melanotaenia boesemani]
MDAESGELFLGDVAAGSWQLHAPFSCSDLILNDTEKPLQDWVEDPDCTLNDSESEDVLHGVDPNQVFDCGLPADPSSESDSGISEEAVVQSPVAMVTPIVAATSQPASATIYQVVYDISRLDRAKTEPGHENVVSIELGEWSSQVLLPDACIVNELPAVSGPDGDLTAADPDHPNLLYPELHLTEEEQKLLTEEGVCLPSNLPLTKAEERILKKVRRKIRNKQSAQDSRRRRKEYIDGLESRAAACSAQNSELQRTVEQLEKHNTSLLAQLRQLQSLIKQTVSKGAQTSTCLLIILVSLSLIILPSFSPFSRRPPADDDYRPTGVISRNILTDPSSSQPTANDGPAVLSDSSPPPSEPGQSGHPAALQEPIKQLENAAAGGESSQSGIVSAVVAGQTETEGGHDTTKLAHADEM